MRKLLTFLMVGLLSCGVAFADGVSSAPYQNPTIINVMDYGAKHDEKKLQNITATSGSPTISGPSGTFTGDAGKNITAFGANPVSFTFSTAGTNYNTTTAATSGHYILAGTITGGFLSTDVGDKVIIAGGGPGGEDIVTTVATYSSSSTIYLTAKPSTTPTGTGTIYRDINTTITSATSTTATLNTTMPASMNIDNVSSWRTNNQTAFSKALLAAKKVNYPATVFAPAGIYHFSANIPQLVLSETNHISLVGDANKTTVLDFTDATIGSGEAGYINITGSHTALGALSTDAKAGNNYIMVNLTNSYDIKTNDLIQISSYDKAQDLLDGGVGATISSATTTGCTLTLSGNPVSWQTVPAGAAPWNGTTGGAEVLDDTSGGSASKIPPGSFITSNNGAGVLTLSSPLDKTGTPYPFTTANQQGGFVNGSVAVYVSDASLLFNRIRPEYNQGEFAEVERVSGTSAPYKVFLRKHLEGTYNASTDWNGSSIYKINAPAVTFANFEMDHDNIPADLSGPIGLQLTYSRDWKMDDINMNGSYNIGLYPLWSYNGVIDRCTVKERQASKGTTTALGVGSCQLFTVQNCNLIAGRRGVDLIGWDPVSDGTFTNNTVQWSHFADFNPQSENIYAFAAHGLARNIIVDSNRLMGGFGCENFANMIVSNNYITGNSNFQTVNLYCTPTSFDFPDGINRMDIQLIGNNIVSKTPQYTLSTITSAAIGITPYESFNYSIGTIMIANNIIKCDRFGIYFFPSKYGWTRCNIKNVFLNNNDVQGSNNTSSNVSIPLYFNNSAPGSGVLTGPVFTIENFEINGGKYESLGNARVINSVANAVETSGKFIARGVVFATNRNSAGDKNIWIIGFSKVELIDCTFINNNTSLVNTVSVGNLSGGTDSKDVYVRVTGCDFKNFSTPISVGYATSYDGYTATAGDLLYSNNHHTLVTGTTSVPASGFRTISEYVNTAVSGVPNVVGYATAAPTTGTWQQGDRIYKSNATGVGSPTATVQGWVYNAGAWQAFNFAP